MGAKEYEENNDQNQWEQKIEQLQQNIPINQIQNKQIPLNNIKEQQFQQKLEKKGFSIEQVQSDGNCLFRAVSDQIYGSEQYHKQIRRIVMEYILAEKSFFTAFVEDQDIERYVEYKKQDGIWGDDIEIQAISEIYDKAIQIYAYSDQPMKTLHENIYGNPIRLSYHGQSHYNSIREKNMLFQQRFGEYEKKALKKAGTPQMEESRKQFQQQGYKTIEQILQDSLIEFKQKEQEEIDEQIQKAIIYQNQQDYLNQQIENQFIQQAIQENDEIYDILNQFPQEFIIQAEQYVGKNPQHIYDFIIQNLL